MVWVEDSASVDRLIKGAGDSEKKAENATVEWYSNCILVAVGSVRSEG